MRGAPSVTKFGVMVPPDPAVDVDESTRRLGRSAVLSVSFIAQSYCEPRADTRISSADALDATAL